jgi:hypothetical protein
MKSKLITTGLAVVVMAGAVMAGLATVVHADELERLGIRMELLPETALNTLIQAGRPRRGPERPADALPDGQPAAGTGNIQQAWLVEPTTRYGHGVLGDGVEADGLRVVLADGTALDFNLGPESVFEDLRPRLVDLDGDGNEEVVVVRSYLDRGAALAVLRVSDGVLGILAETPAIGQSSRWLNPVGAGDFDGDGRVEIAYVQTPHIGGILRIWRLQDGKLVELAKAEGFSNHAIGSRSLGLSAILDINGDGADDLLVPSASRRTLRIMSFAGGEFQELAQARHPVRIKSDITVRDLDENGEPDIAYNLDDGTLVLLHR